MYFLFSLFIPLIYFLLSISPESLGIVCGSLWLTAIIMFDHFFSSEVCLAAPLYTYTILVTNNNMTSAPWRMACGSHFRQHDGTCGCLFAIFHTFTKHAPQIFLGFADDVLDLRWSVKIFFSLWASLPLLVSYLLICACVLCSGQLSSIWVRMACTFACGCIGA